MRQNTRKWSRRITEWYPSSEKRKKGRQGKTWRDELDDTRNKCW